MELTCAITVLVNLSVIARSDGTVGVAVVLAACSKSTPSGAPEQSAAPPPPPPTAQSAAEAIKAAVPEITELVPLTEENDDNNLLGRPNGYSAAVVLIDPRSKGLCDLAKPGADCGATVEQWPDQEAAQRRADYIQKALASMPALGTEWSVVKGNLLLRVTGKLPPSVEKTYEAAFKG